MQTNTELKQKVIIFTVTNLLYDCLDSQSGKGDSLKHISKRSANMYKSSGSYFFKTSNGTQSQTDILEESKSIVTLLTILGLKDIMQFQFQISSREEL